MTQINTPSDAERAQAVLDKLRGVVRRNYALTTQKKLAEQDHCCPNCDWAVGIQASTGETIGWECAATGRREMFV